MIPRHQLDARILREHLGEGGEVEGPIPRPLEQEDEAYLGGATILNLGPVHPATEGALRLLLEVDGETVLAATPVVGYLHRGLEKLAEHLSWEQLVPASERVDPVAALHGNVALVLAVEALAEIRVPRRAQALRMIACELARLSVHLHGLGSMARLAGATASFHRTMRERERVLYLTERLCGARITTSYTRVGGLARDLPEGWAEECGRYLDLLPARIDELDRRLARDPVWQLRTRGVGVVSREDAIRHGLRGPVLRASGVPYDLRKGHPYLLYDEVDFEVPVGSEGDALDRCLVRLEEMRQAGRILRQCLADLPEGPVRSEDAKVSPPPRERVKASIEEMIHHFVRVTEDGRVPEGRYFHAVEAPRGELGVYLISQGGPCPWRFRLSAPSFANLSYLPRLAPGHRLADLPVLLGSLGLAMSECDR